MLLLLLLIAGLQMAAARPSDQSTSAVPEGQSESKEESPSAAPDVAPSAPTVPASSPAAAEAEGGGGGGAAAEAKDTDDTQQAHKKSTHSGTVGASLLGPEFSSDHGNVHGWSHGTPHSSGAAAGAAAAARSTGEETAAGWDGTAHASIHGSVHGNEGSGGGGGTGVAENQPHGRKISLNVLPTLSPNPYFHEVPVLLKGPKYSFLSYQSKVSVDLGDDVWGVPEFPVDSDFGGQVGEESPAKSNMGNAFGSKRPHWAQDEEEGWSAGHSTAIAAQDEEGFGYGGAPAGCTDNGVSADDEAAFLEALVQAQAQEEAAAAAAALAAAAAAFATDYGSDYDEVAQAVANANAFGDYPDYGATFVNDYDAIYNALAGVDADSEAVAEALVAGANDFGAISEALALIGEEDAALASVLGAYGDDGVDLVAEYLASVANANAAAYGAQGDPHLTHAYGPGAAVASAGSTLSHVTYGSHGSLPWHRPSHGGAAANSNSNQNKATYGGGGVVNADALQKVTYGGAAAVSSSSASSASSASSEDGDGARPTASASSASDADPAEVTLAKTVSDALAELPTAKTKSVKATTRVRLASKIKGKARRSTAAAFLRA